MFLFPLDKYLQVELLDHTDVLFPLRVFQVGHNL